MSSQKQREKQRLKRKAKKKERKRELSAPTHPHGILDLRTGALLPSHAEKMSEVFETFVAPFWDECDTDDEYHKVLTLGMIAWNACLLAEDKRNELLHDTLATVPPETREGLALILDTLMQRKQTLFAHNTRMILDYRFEATSNGGNLRVLSTLDNA